MDEILFPGFTGIPIDSGVDRINKYVSVCRARAMGQERERCAKIAESYSCDGEPAVTLAAKIRGQS